MIDPRNAPPARSGSTLPRTLALIVLSVLAGALVVLALASAGRVRDEANDSVCQGRLKQLGSMLLNYRDSFGCLPPAYITDEAGAPLYSWRVLLLPYCELHQLYDEFDFTEAWNGPKNSRIDYNRYNSFLRKVFSCETQHRGSTVVANYVAIVGSNTMWPGDRPSIATEPTAEKLLLIEISDSMICWSEPSDPTLTTSFAQDGFPTCRTKPCPHPSGFHGLTTFGNVVTFPPMSDSTAIKEWLEVPAVEGGALRSLEQGKKILVRRLLQCLQDPWQMRRHGAALILGQMNADARTALPHLDAAARDSNPQVAKAAAMAIRKITQMEVKGK